MAVDTIVSRLLRNAEETPTTPAYREKVDGAYVTATWGEYADQVRRAGLALISLGVKPGDVVRAGDLLVRLDTVDAGLAVREAEAQLASAEAQVDILEAQPRSVDVAAAEQKIEEAETGIAQAEAELERLESSAIGSDIAQAEAEVESAEAEREAARIDYDELQKELENDRVEDWEGERAALRLRAARENLEAAKLTLAQSRGSAAPRLEEAEAGVRSAEAQKALAEAQLRLVRAGVPEQEIGLTEIDVERARVGLDEAQLRLTRCERRAPFDGTIGMVHVREGEEIRQGDIVITLGDLSTLRVETTDLDEIDVAKVRVGQPVDITFDAFPDRVFAGRVVRIDPMAEEAGGGVNYTTTIELDDLAPEIRWGMTAFVDIDVEQ